MNATQTTIINTATEAAVNLDVVRERLEQVDSLIQAASIRAPEILTVAADLLHEAVDVLNGEYPE